MKNKYNLSEKFGLAGCTNCDGWGWYMVHGRTPKESRAELCSCLKLKKKFEKILAQEE